MKAVESIGDYISESSEASAGAVVDALLRSTEPLEQFPRMGRIVPEAADEALRELFVFNYRVIYRVVSEEHVTVTNVIRSRRIFRPDKGGAGPDAT
ncbi:type II toxin-antitoxin system RelE/ParE family toxin [bacterium]|nr:type II toxin-antitoxin system RelE/ParE family toxin [bacterium]